MSPLYLCPSVFICGSSSPYYYANGKRIAMRRNGNLSYLFTDHLGGTSVVLDISTGMTSTTTFYPLALTGKTIKNPDGTYDRRRPDGVDYRTGEVAEYKTGGSSARARAAAWKQAEAYADLLNDAYGYIDFCAADYRA